MLVYLSASPDEATAVLSTGLERIYPHIEFRRAKPKQDRHKLIAGHTRQSEGFGPHPSGRPSDIAPVDAVWTVPPGDPLDVEIAAKARIPVTVLHEATIREALSVPSPKPDRPRLFRGARDVIRVYYTSIEQVIGCSAIDYARTKGDGNAHGVVQRIERTTERLAKALHVVVQSGVSQRTLAILRATVVQGLTYKQAGEVVGLSDAHAHRLAVAGLGKIANKLKSLDLM